MQFKKRNYGPDYVLHGISGCVTLRVSLTMVIICRCKIAAVGKYCVYSWPDKNEEDVKQ